MKPIISVKNLSKHFGGLKAIDDLTTEIPQGTTTGLIGPNGSGKTTLMNILTGILKPEQGSIQINDKTFTSIDSTSLRKLKIARTFQDGRLIGQLSVEDNLLLTTAKNGLFKSMFDFACRKQRKRMEEVLKIIHLKDHRKKNAEELSYGQGKLLEIGRTLMQDPDIYFFDEPFTGLFPQVVEQVMEIMQDLKAQGKTLVIIEHNMELISRLCEHIIVLDYGKLLSSGKPCDVLANKQVQEAYLGK